MIGFYSHIGVNQRAIGAVDYEQVTVDDTVRTLTAAKVAAAVYAFLRVIGGPIRATIHRGGVPTSAFGFTLFDGDNFVLNIYEMQHFAAVREGAANGTVQVAYYSQNAT